MNKIFPKEKLMLYIQWTKFERRRKRISREIKEKNNQKSLSCFTKAREGVNKVRKNISIYVKPSIKSKKERHRGKGQKKLSRGAKRKLSSMLSRFFTPSIETVIIYYSRRETEIKRKKKENGRSVSQFFSLPPPLFLDPANCTTSNEGIYRFSALDSGLFVLTFHA